MISKRPTRGYVTIAHNSGNTDYVRMAYALGLSLRGQSEVNKLSILVPEETVVPPAYMSAFDQVITMREDISKEDSWKIHNKWNVFFHSPYDETVLLDADMLFTMDVSDWWKGLRHFDCLGCTRVLTHRGDVVTSDYYRKVFTHNYLPNIYTAFFYFKKRRQAETIFLSVKDIIENWEIYTKKYLSSYLPTRVSGDVAFALAMMLNSADHKYVSPLSIPTFVHMKSNVQNFESLISEEWTKHLLYDVTKDGNIFVGNHRQMYPFHYHDKNFLTDDIIETLEHLYD